MSANLNIRKKNSDDKIDRWLSFLNDWDDQFVKGCFIISYLSSYPKTLDKIHLINLIDIDNIENVQKEWVWLCGQFENDLEKEFFKSHWLPIQEGSIDIFMDISSNEFPIFETHYFFFEPYRWYKKYLIENISDLMLAEDTSIDLSELLKKYEKKRWKMIDEFFAERRKMGLSD